MVLSFKNVIQLHEKSELALARIKESPLKITPPPHAALLRLFCPLRIL